jgi:hypothetical protein
MDKLKQISNNLLYIKASIENDTHLEQAAILNLIITETVEAARQLDFSFIVPYSSENHLNHLYTFFQYGMKAKAKLITSLEELKRELTKKNGNKKRVLKLVENLLSTDLYKRDVNNSIDKWVNTTSFQTKHQIIYTDRRGRINQ